MEAYWGVKV